MSWIKAIIRIGRDRPAAHGRRRTVLRERFDLHHVTLQMETEACEGDDCGRAHGGHGEPAHKHDHARHDGHAH